ncbi:MULTISPECIES: siderophore-interacting protein [unclassified Microbacterium]|uniref:siderophore-interacting protein n=1 Tax=unclassified Microbacterium TaxID=2609290 RepID=UPI00214ABB69|nr:MULTISPECIES: siderophore-interacting protein [unclassified Microbacterium]MCR2809857.1 siderophore-interacting protein [Microbacterium sp. zg.B185]WIM17834.1 siderophore-interacting protein [Microbacterium sp. zg-B185]
MSSSVAVGTRPSYRPYAATVADVHRLSPHFVRVVFTGPDFGVFGTAGLDQRVKLILPLADGTLSDIGQHDEAVIDAGDWYTMWRELPGDARGPLRTYTVRRIDPGLRELTVDFVVHHDAGPAGAWAERAARGQQVVIVGPDQRSEGFRLGLDWHPGTARRIMLAGDETAAPAICSILESLDESYDVDAFIEVPAAADRQSLDLPAGFRVTWLERDDRGHGDAVTQAVTAWSASAGDVLAKAAAPRRQELADIDVDRDLLWDSPEDSEGEFYAWIAGEAAMVKALRRHLVQGCGVDRKRVAFMGYWRLGQSERQE